MSKFLITKNNSQPSQTIENNQKLMVDIPFFATDELKHQYITNELFNGEDWETELANSKDKNVLRNTETSFTVHTDLESIGLTEAELFNKNYIVIQENGVNYYCFIVNIEKRNLGVWSLSCDLDVFTQYNLKDILTGDLQHLKGHAIRQNFGDQFVSLATDKYNPNFNPVYHQQQKVQEHVSKGVKIPYQDQELVKEWYDLNADNFFIYVIRGNNDNSKKHYIKKGETVLKSDYSVSVYPTKLTKMWVNYNQAGTVNAWVNMVFNPEDIFNSKITNIVKVYISHYFPFDLINTDKIDVNKIDLGKDLNFYYYIDPNTLEQVDVSKDLFLFKSNALDPDTRNLTFRLFNNFECYIEVAGSLGFVSPQTPFRTETGGAPGATGNYSAFCEIFYTDSSKTVEKPAWYLTDNTLLYNDILIQKKYNQLAFYNPEEFQIDYKKGSGSYNPLNELAIYNGIFDLNLGIIGDTRKYKIPSYVGRNNNLGFIMNLTLDTSGNDQEFLRFSSNENGALNAGGDLNDGNWEGFYIEMANYLTVGNDQWENYRQRNKTQLIFERVSAGITGIVSAMAFATGLAKGKSGLIFGSTLTGTNSVEKLGQINHSNLKNKPDQMTTTNGYLTYLSVLLNEDNLRYCIVYNKPVGNYLESEASKVYRFGVDFNIFSPDLFPYGQRTKFNFVQISNAFNNITNLSTRLKEYISSTLENGVRLWHYQPGNWTGIMDFSTDNTEVNLNFESSKERRDE